MGCKKESPHILISFSSSDSSSHCHIHIILNLLSFLLFARLNPALLKKPQAKLQELQEIKEQETRRRRRHRALLLFSSHFRKKSPDAGEDISFRHRAPAEPSTAVNLESAKPSAVSSRLDPCGEWRITFATTTWVACRLRYPRLVSSRPRSPAQLRENFTGGRGACKGAQCRPCPLPDPALRRSGVASSGGGGDTCSESKAPCSFQEGGVSPPETPMGNSDEPPRTRCS